MEHTLGLQLVMILAAATAAVALCRILGLSPILGYLATGIIIGPQALGWLDEGPTTRMLAELGVVLLMFTVGLEFSLSRLLSMKRLVLGLGGAQVVITMTLFGLAAWGIGQTPAAALILGGALAMSSTAIVLKQLGEQMELPTQHGRIATGILLFQDIAAVPLLVILPILASAQSDIVSALALALLKATLVFVTLIVAGRFLLPRVLDWVGKTHSLELFMLSSLLLVLAAAGLSTLADLSPTLGAFMAGMLLGETVFRHQIEADIRPFRDIMLGLFFTTIGMQLQPQVFIQQPFTVLLVWLSLVLGKAAILTPLVRRFGVQTLDARRSAILLAQGGEFGLLLIAAALTLGLIPAPTAQPVLAGLILSMVSAPLLLRYSGQIAALGSSTQKPIDSKEGLLATLETECADFDRHVIIVGYGRIGEDLLHLLDDEGVQALALDLDPQRVAAAATAGEPVWYGNATQPAILEAAGIARARAIIVTSDDPRPAIAIVGHLRSLGNELPVIARSIHRHQDQALQEAGIEVFPEGMETSLAFAGRVLVTIGIPATQVEARLAAIRGLEYAPLRGDFSDMESR